MQEKYKNIHLRQKMLERLEQMIQDVRLFSEDKKVMFSECNKYGDCNLTRSEMLVYRNVQSLSHPVYEYKHVRWIPAIKLNQIHCS